MRFPIIDFDHKFYKQHNGNAGDSEMYIEIDIFSFLGT